MPLATEFPQTDLSVVFQDNSDVHVDDEEIGDDYVGHHERNSGPVTATFSTVATKPSPIGQLVMGVVAAKHIHSKVKGQIARNENTCSFLLLFMLCMRENVLPVRGKSAVVDLQALSN